MAKFKENAMRAVFLLSACVCIAAVLLICVFLLAEGIPGLREIGVWKFISGTTWDPSSDTYGILPMILASVYVTSLALLFGAPAGILCAIYMAKFCPNALYRILKPAVNLLAGIPSVVYGLFGLTVIVPAIRNAFGGSGTSLLAASVVLAIMILPTIISVTEASLRAVPDTYLDGALALGASREYGAFTSVLPAAKSGVASAVILGVDRAIGETMAVYMVAGNQAIMPTSIFKGVRTLTANIVIELGYAADLQRQALIATGVVLLVFILAINVLLSLVKKRDSL